MPVKSDGNGGVIINKSFAIITTTITLLILITSVTANVIDYVDSTSKINKADIAILKQQNETHRKLIASQNTDIAVIKTEMIAINKALERIEKKLD